MEMSPSISGIRETGVTFNKFCIMQKMTLISDGCGYQNRNRVVNSVLRDFAVQHNVTIEQIYLTKGHTMMEVDSVHATLEQLFYPPINSSSDYIAKMRSARLKQPNEVKPRRNYMVQDRGRLTQIYDKPLPISESKFKDPQNLKSAIEKEHHAFYDKLSFKPVKKTNDKLFSENAAENHDKNSRKKLKIKVLKKQPGNKKPTEKSQKR
ncbi:unnamed protein product [Psylliodes chrysocephalus]|uniref:Uncharacterized protein n=1 Tax=Psylliodes chrysocephalus TaxID=3402493 RepID=A0A9P0CM40_9CUCU|nr:unnamed protein product [Psylliodes chrysocephala]